MTELAPLPIPGIDHLILLTDDLARCAAEFIAAGFTVSRRPDLPNGRSETRFVSFADGSYLMLMQYLSQDAADAHRLGKAARLGEGWADYSIWTTGIADAAARLAGVGAPANGPTAHTGPLATGEAWALRILFAGWGAGDPVLPYFVEDTAPRAFRIPSGPDDVRHKNAARAISGVVVLVDDYARHAAPLAALFGASRPRTVETLSGTMTVHRHAAGPAFLDYIDIATLQGCPEIADEHSRRGNGVCELVLAGGVPGTTVAASARLRIADD